MLPNKFWNEWEPRVSFPTFKGVENLISFTPDLSLNRKTTREFALPLYYLWKKQKSLKSVIKNFQWLIVSPKLRFRGALLSRDGTLLSPINFEGEYGPGDIFTANVSTLMRELNLPDEDGQFLLIASRGRNDWINSAPGNTTVRYVGKEFISGYRTGFFARPLNSSQKNHYGFTGINPQVMVTDTLESAILLINHSSNPAYTLSVNPKVRLYRNTKEFIEADFGEIPPLGIRERSVLSLFPNAREFLAKAHGLGTTVTKVKGATLASFHITRSLNGDSFGIEHSRPTHSYVVHYTRMKGYNKKAK
ncbi:MAG TPA: hypothetical protein DCP55_04540 [Chitinophagaceae bacterium]|nr:hypothetical protein [bacterium]HAL95220.1 hypothetical protein [Chitinophagaceae bacterium]